MSPALARIFREKLENLFREVARRNMDLTMVQVLEHMVRWMQDGEIPAGAYCEPQALFAIIQETWEQEFVPRKAVA